jgi:uncharacterized membrane protein YdbT with pleckstrin-like domain
METGMSSTTEAAPQATIAPPPLPVSERIIREVWPSVTVIPAAASLGKTLIRSIILAPLGWMLLLPIYFMKILPFIARRYTLTNRRLMIQRGLKPKPSHEVALSEIDDAQIVESTIDTFYRSATLNILSGGKVALQLPGVPDPESFRHAVLDARTAWAPYKNGA